MSQQQHSNRHVFDEARLEIAGSISGGSTHENGVFLIPSLYFDTLNSRDRRGFDKLLHPRFFVSGSFSTAGNADQIMAGASWKFKLLGPIFTDLGFGGALNNGDLSGNSDGPKLGSHLLFHEYASIGVNLTSDWNLTATIRHSSNANLASPNDGLTYAGLGIGRTF